MPTATESGIDVRAAHAAGLDFLRKNKGPAALEAGKAPENRKIKNKAEIDRVKKENERVRGENEKIEKRRTEIADAVHGAMDLVAGKLASKNLSEKERARLTWIKNSTKNAYDKLEKGKYVVEVKEGEKVVESRQEGLPVESLMSEVDMEVQSLRRDIRQMEQIQGLKEKADKNGLTETEKKSEWYKVLENLPDGKLKKRIVARAEGWKELDEARGEKYDKDKMEQQMGEACFEVMKEYSQEQLDRLKKLGGEKSREAGRLEKILNTLDGASEKYFFHHYRKLSSELNDSEKNLQDKYTKHEANYISKDNAYREMLLEDFEGELPKGFDQMDKERQDYELAMLALDNRLILNMPRKKKLLEEPAPIYEEEPNPVVPPEPHPHPHPHPHPEPIEPHPRPVKPEPINPNPEPIRPDPVPVRPEPVPEPHPKPIEKQDKKLFLIDISEIAKRMAWTQTEERITKEYQGMGRVKRALKGLTEGKRRVEYFQAALKDIQSDNNLMRCISQRLSGELTHDTPRVSSEYLQLLDKTVAEYSHDVVDAQREVGESMKDNPEVRLAFSELLYRVSNNKWDGEEYKNLDERARVELFVKKNIAQKMTESGKSWGSDDRKNEAKGLLYASNFYEICKSVSESYKEQIDAAVRDVMAKNPEANIEAVRDAISKQVEGVQGLELNLGLKERDIVNNRPKGILRFYERMVSWGEGAKVDKQTGTMSLLSKPKQVIGRILMNPVVLGGLSAVTSRGVMTLAKSKWGIAGAAVALGASGFWVPLGIGVVVGGLYRMAKRAKDVKYDIAQELRHETLGGKGSEILDKNGGLRYEGAAMSYKEVFAQLDLMKGKKVFSEAEMQQLAKIYARLQRERDELKDTKKKFTKLDLFNLEEEEGKRFGSPAAAKADLRIRLSELAKSAGMSDDELQRLLQSRIDIEKVGITKIVKETNKRQTEFLRSETFKSGVGGMVLGFAGGLLAQEAIHLGGEQVEKLWGGHYFKSHGTNFDHIRDWVKGSHLYQSHFGQGAAVGATADHALGGMWHSRDASAHEWVDKIKDHVSGGQVEHSHTHEWYDNNSAGQSAAEHLHNANELKLMINKDTGGNLHFKVPVQEGGSWVIHGNHFESADLQKAFAEGHIKMLFVPDGSGSGAHETITFQINPVTKELIIPLDSNIRNLFDEATGMFKGNGYFGLAEQVGTNKDGSTIYNWINSLRGNGGHINFGQNAWQDDIRVVGPAAAESVSDYNSFTIPTVPPQRKVFMRPEERAAKEEKKKKEDAEKAKKKAEKDAKKKGKKSSGLSTTSSGHAESGGGGGGGSQETTKKPETQEPTVKVPEFKGDVLKRYTDKKYASELLEKYNEKPEGLAKIDVKSIKFVIEGKKGLNIPVRKDLAKAVWQLEQALVAGKVISQEKADEHYGDIAEPATAPAKTGAETGKSGSKPAGEGEKHPAKKDEVPAGTFKAERRDDDTGEAGEKQTPERKGDELKNERLELEAKWGKKFNIKIPSDPEKRKLAAESLANLGRALNRADAQSVELALGKKSRGKEKLGLYVEFVKPGGEPKFEDGALVLPADAGPVEILKVLETVGIKRKARADSEGAARRPRDTKGRIDRRRAA